MLIIMPMHLFLIISPRSGLKKGKANKHIILLGRVAGLCCMQQREITAKSRQVSASL